jgi:hypothetical protein
MGGNSASLVTAQWADHLGTDILIRTAKYDRYYYSKTLLICFFNPQKKLIDLYLVSAGEVINDTAILNSRLTRNVKKTF